MRGVAEGMHQALQLAQQGGVGEHVGAQEADVGIAAADVLRTHGLGQATVGCVQPQGLVGQGVGIHDRAVPERSGAAGDVALARADPA